jgi:hypothetical protein
MAELICFKEIEIGNTIYNIGDKVTCAGIYHQIDTILKD